MIEYAKLVGHCEEIKDLLEMIYEDMIPGNVFSKEVT